MPCSWNVPRRRPRLDYLRTQESSASPTSSAATLPSKPANVLKKGSNNASAVDGDLIDETLDWDGKMSMVLGKAFKGAPGPLPASHGLPVAKRLLRIANKDV